DERIKSHNAGWCPCPSPEICKVAHGEGHRGMRLARFGNHGRRYIDTYRFYTAFIQVPRHIAWPTADVPHWAATVEPPDELVEKCKIERLAFDACNARSIFTGYRVVAVRDALITFCPLPFRYTTGLWRRVRQVRKIKQMDLPYRHGLLSREEVGSENLG